MRGLLSPTVSPAGNKLCATELFSPPDIFFCCGRVVSPQTNKHGSVVYGGDGDDNEHDDGDDDINGDGDDENYNDHEDGSERFGKGCCKGGPVSQIFSSPTKLNNRTLSP